MMNMMNMMKIMMMNMMKMKNKDKNKGCSNNEHPLFFTIFFF